MQRLIGLIASALAAALGAATALAGPIVQSGSVTPGHGAMWTADGVVQDSGPATQGFFTELGVTKNGGDAICVASAPPTKPRTVLCLGTSTTGGGTISLDTQGESPAQPLTFDLNGTPALTLTPGMTGLVGVAGIPVIGNCAVWTTSSSIGDAGAPCGSGGSASIPNDTMLGNVSGATAPATAMTPKQINALLSTFDNAIAEGADPTGMADSTTAIQAAMNTCAAYIPPGTYKITATLTSGSCANITYIGAGSSLTKIVMYSTTADAFKNAATNGYVQGMTWDRSGTPTAGLGMNFAAVTNQMYLYDLVAQNQWQGFWLGVASYSTAQNLVAQQNYSDGFLITDSFVNGATQWTLNTVLAQKNNGWCINVTALGSVVMQLIQWNDVTCYANSAGGIKLAATSTSNRIEGFQLNAGDLNTDGNDELQIGTYALDPIIVTQTEISLAGTLPTGRNLATAASNVGNGINILNTNGKVLLVNDTAIQNADDGIACQTGAVTDALELDGVIAELNGAATPGATHHGLAVACTPTATLITGGSYGNRTGSINQAYGIGLVNGNGVTLTGINVPSNNINGIVIGTNASSAYCTGIQGESMTLIGCNQGSGGGGGGGVTSLTAASGGNIVLTPSTITTTGTIGTVGSPTFSGLILSGITGSVQCLHVDATGHVSGIGADCGTGGGGGSVTSIAATAPLVASSPTGAVTLGFSNFGGGEVVGNSTTGSAAPVDSTIGAVIDAWITVNGGTAPQGSILTKKGATVGTWGSTTPGTSGQFLWANSSAIPTWHTLASGDITTALGYAPVNKAGDTMSGGLTAPAMAVTTNFGLTGATSQICWQFPATPICDGVTGTIRQVGTNASEIRAAAPFNPAQDYTANPGYTLGTPSLRWDDIQTYTETIYGALDLPITGSTQCLHVNTSGVVSGTGSDCGTGSGGSVSITSGNSNIVVSPSPITGTGTITMASNPSFTSVTTTAAATVGTNLYVGGGTAVELSSNGTSLQLTVPAGGGLIPTTTNSFVLGSSANRWADIRTTTETLTGALTTNITGLTECVQANSTGVLSGTGSACSTATPTSITSGNSNITVSPSPITGTGTITMASNPTFASVTTTAAATVGTNLYVGGGTAVELSSNATSLQLTVPAGGGIIPTTNNSFVLGSSANHWADIETTTETLAGALTVGGTVIANGSPSIEFANNTNSTITGNGSGVMTLHSTFSIAADTPTFGPLTSATGTHLGNSGDLWIDVWASNNVIQTSDRREKRNIEPSDLGLDFINRLTPVSYEWRDPKAGLGTHYGLIAQDVEKVLNGKSFAGLHAPANDNERYGLAYDDLIAPLIKAVQQLSAENVELKHRIDVLEQQRAGGAR